MTLDIEVVGETSDGWDAVERTLELKPDVVVADFSDPDLAGIRVPKFISLVKESTCQRTDFLSDTLESEAKGVLLKSVDREDLGKVPSLTGREREVLPMLANAITNRQIAEKLYVSPNSVQTYRQRIMKKLDLRNGIDILKYALRRGLVTLDER